MLLGMSNSKRCPNCQKTKPYSDFNKSNSRSDGLCSWCRECDKIKGQIWRDNNKERKNEYAKKYYQENKSKSNAKRIERLYGLTAEQHQELKDKQNNLCKLCGQPETATNSMNGKVQELSVDHCHDSNRVRGLLCRKCNYFIGCLGDTEASLERVYHYMKGELE